MENTSMVTTFILTDFYKMEDLKHLYFVIFLVLYITTVSLNCSLIGVIYTESSLHSPMYIFVCNLACNGLYMSTFFLPSLISNLMSHSYEVSLAYCLSQIFFLHTSGLVELNVLAVMSYDRYVAICFPLDYHNRMSPAIAWKLIALSWCYPFVGFALYLILTIRLTFCSRHIQKIYCVNFVLVKLSCTDTSINNIVGLTTISVFMAPQIIMIIFSYALILYVCLHSSKNSKTKAIKTCTPHILAVLNFCVGCFFEIIQSRFNLSFVIFGFRTFMSLYFFIFPPVLNPLIYGVSIQAIRERLVRLFNRMKGISPNCITNK
ncbi:olfactory receptor 4B13-like [Conger conger]|uniref:olfactory receptor 4B13-like n=1 Tax=Conger conger TaxID=82655 RepID=UPI002A5ADB68|nr:olfactory receptor 4B13-like [Conger conger]